MSDIKAVDKIIETKSRNFQKEAFIYKFTNERLSSYLPLFDLKNKDIMTVVGSGDHYLNILLNEVNNIDCFDINKFAYYYLVLKKYAIIALSKDDFIRFFITSDFDLNLYQKIREKFDKEDQKILVFWDYVMKLSFEKRRNLFKEDVDKSEIFEYNDYLKNAEYLILKDKLREYEINFIHTSLQKLHLAKGLKKYDYIFISNITDYLFNIFNDNALKQYKNLLINDYDKIIKPNGSVLAYQFDKKFSFAFSLLGISSYEELYQKLGYYFSDLDVLDDSLMVYQKKR